MKWIEKNTQNEPKSLRLHRQKSFSNYDNYAEKDDLRKALLEEQGYICCYCLSRIQAPTQEKMKIEHWKSQHAFGNFQLDYKNLLACCRGNEWSDSKDFHCDMSKGEHFIVLNPMNKNMVEQIMYGRFGNIAIDIKTLQKEIDEILNLNTKTLRTQREGIYKGVTLFLRKKFGDKQVSKSDLNKEIKHWSEKRNGKFEPFCSVAIYFLTKALAKAL